MKLVSYNIRFGLGLDQKIDLGRIADTVNDADIIALQEVERYWKHSGMTDPCNRRVGHVDGFLDSWTLARGHSDDRISWFPDPPERAPGYPICLDYCFVSPHLSQKVEHVWVDQDQIGSDHKPYWVELDF